MSPLGLALLSILSLAADARYNAYVTTDGTDNPSCSEPTPCGLFQYVIQNVESGNIPNDDLVISINGSNANIVDDSLCEMTLTGNITFILNPGTVSTASDWFGAGVLSSCSISYNMWMVLSYNLITVAEDSHIAFHHLVWDHDLPFLQSLERSTFYCENCIIQNTNTGFTLFLLSNDATFNHSTFYNLDGGMIFELFPLKWIEGGDTADLETDTVLTLTRCSISQISSSVFIDIEASNGMLISYKSYKSKLVHSDTKCVFKVLTQSCFVQNSLLCMASQSEPFWIIHFNYSLDLSLCKHVVSWFYVFQFICTSLGSQDDMVTSQ